MEAPTQLLEVTATIVDTGCGPRSFHAFFQQTGADEPGVLGDVVVRGEVRVFVLQRFWSIRGGCRVGSNVCALYMLAWLSLKRIG